MLHISITHLHYRPTNNNTKTNNNNNTESSHLSTAEDRQRYRCFSCCEQLDPNNPNTMLSSLQSPHPGQTPVLGNTWKFTACVAALAITTSMLILAAVKGPSWYKQFHNYRHRRLEHEEEGDGPDAMSTVFSETGTYVQHQTFVFEEEDGQMEMEEKEEEDEDGYFEDPYIRRDE